MGVDFTVNYYNKFSSAFSEKTILTRSELINCLKAQKPMLKDSSYGWLLYELCQKCIIKRVSHNAYSLYPKENTLKKYEADLSDEAVAVLEFLKDRFPLITFKVQNVKISVESISC